ncbi:transposase family protein [Petroclostridium xylanilyticum]
MIIFDPRQEGKVWHKLVDILFIAVVAVVYGFNEWEEKLLKILQCLKDLH